MGMVGFWGSAYICGVCQKSLSRNICDLPAAVCAFCEARDVAVLVVLVVFGLFCPVLTGSALPVSALPAPGLPDPVLADRSGANF